jgi:hypothetical protein
MRHGRIARRCANENAVHSQCECDALLRRGGAAAALRLRVRCIRNAAAGRRLAAAASRLRGPPPALRARTIEPNLQTMLVTL